MDSCSPSLTRRILIVDDSIAMVHLLASIVADLGEVLFATTGHEGIALAWERQPDLILLDVELPDASGYEICKVLKQHDQTSACAVIIVTGQMGADFELRALESGAVDFINKPVNPPIVRARVQTHLTLQQQAETLRHLANVDGLTSVANRRFFDEALATELRRHHRRRAPLSLAMIDVDYFKRYNDLYGHLDGDQCLRVVAATIAAHTRRPGELVARYGGEEFVVILPDTPAQDALNYGQWICEQIAKLALPHAASTMLGVVTASIGVTTSIPDDGVDNQTLIAAADAALYHAKRNGRNRVEFGACERRAVPNEQV